MFKRILVMATLVCALPAMANAWSLNTWAKSGGGNIAVRGGAAQTSAQGSVFTSYTTTVLNPNNTVHVVVTAALGYTISKVTQNGVVTTGPVSPYNTTVAGPTAQSVYATFKANTVAVTADCGAGGSVSPRSLSNIYYGQTALAAIKFVFTPKAGYAVGPITGKIGTMTETTSATGSVTVTIPKGFVFNSAIALSASPTSTSPVANAGTPQTVLTGALVTLSGAATGTPAFTNWSSANFPRVVLTNGTTLTPSFIAGAPGTYTFKLAVGGASSAFTTVTVTNSLIVAAKNACVNCHIANGVGAAANVYSNWSTSAHAANSVSCATCHVGANTGAHPGVTVTSANSCEICHSGPYGAPTTNFLKSVHWTNQMNTFTDLATARAYLLAAEGPTGADVPPQGDWAPDCSISCHFTQTVGKDACNACHNPHRPETGLPTDLTAANVIFFAYSTPANGINGDPLKYGYWRHDTGCVNCHHQGNGEGNAQYLYDDNDFPTAPHFDITADGSGVAFMNAGQACANCHGHYNDINTQYGLSGHANVASPAWAEGGTSSPCVRCHTTQGFINYSSFHVTTAITATKSVLGCNGCHTSPDMSYSLFGNLTSVNGKVGNIRKIAAFPGPYKNGSNSSFTFSDAGPSNVCIPCHAGLSSGQTIKALAAPLSNVSFKNPHYAAAAGILYQSIGYEFAGQSYAKPVYFAHDQIGINHFAEAGKGETGVVGPCATCHYLDGPGHTLHIFTKDQTGAVTAVNSTLCVICHSTYPMGVAAANSNITGFQAALAALQAELQLKGAYYSPSTYPYFFTDLTYTTALKNWTLGGPSDGTNNMGAAFNLQLLTKEPGAYAHNRYYTKRLIFDSIDWLQNGAITGHINVSGDAATYLGTVTRP